MTAIAAARAAPLPDADALLAAVKTSLEDDKAIDLTVLPLPDDSSVCDFMVVASGGSTRQVGAMADHLVEKLKAIGAPTPSVEGKAACDWVLVDAGDVVVHLFRPEVREFYQLEKMWTDPPAQPNRS
ncbi:MAG: ribosome silencing factor [Pseudomonadota bacterium]